MPIRPISFSDNILKIEVPNSYFIEWIDEHYNTVINKTVNHVLGENGKLLYVVLDNDEFSNDVTTIIEEEKEKQELPKAQQQVRPDFESYLIPKYKFGCKTKNKNSQSPLNL